MIGNPEGVAAIVVNVVLKRDFYPEWVALYLNLIWNFSLFLPALRYQVVIQQYFVYVFFAFS